jgi:hypothetical protein
MMYMLPVVVTVVTHLPPFHEATMNSDTTNPAGETAGERQSNGRFAKGNRGGPGNPFARKTAQLRQALVDAVTPDRGISVSGWTPSVAVFSVFRECGTTISSSHGLVSAGRNVEGLGRRWCSAFSKY